MDLKVVGQRIKSAREAKSHARGTGCISKFKSNACECNRERLESYKIGYLCCNCKCIRCFSRYTID